MVSAEDDLRKFLEETAAHRSEAWGHEFLETAFVALGSGGDSLRLARAYFAQRPNYQVELRPVDDWLKVFDETHRALFGLTATDVQLIDEFLKTIAGANLMTFECVVTSALKGDPFLRPHYGVWWADVVVAGGNGSFLLHCARSD